MAERYWQIEEGGPLVKTTSERHPWYGRAFWRKKLRVHILQRDPICVMCQREASTDVDHVVPWMTAEGIVSWALFSDPNNCRGLCHADHSIATATFDRGFGNVARSDKTAQTVPTGESGKQFVSSTVGNAALDKALGSEAELKALLEGIPQ